MQSLCQPENRLSHHLVKPLNPIQIAPSRSIQQSDLPMGKRAMRTKAIQSIQAGAQLCPARVQHYAANFVTIKSHNFPLS
jgi:hypothetical protein